MENLGSFGLEVAKMTGSLAIVLLLLLATVYGLKRFGLRSKRSGTSRLIDVIAQHQVGLKHYLMLVKVREQTFLLGVSPQGMHFLSAINDSPPPSNKDDLT